MWLRPTSAGEQNDTPYPIGRFDSFPILGETRLDRLAPMMVRSWFARLHTEHNVSGTTAAKAYRLLRSILAAAVDDELIARNPCVLKGAGVEHYAERPILTVAQVRLLLEAIEPRYRGMVLLATWAGLRFGESAGLKRMDLDLGSGFVRIERQLQELKSGELIEGPPKTAAGRRVIAIPPHILADLEDHLDRYTRTESEAYVFTSPDGTALRRSNFNRRVWQPACDAIGLVGFRFHDLRHTGNTLAASTGASTKELMARMGHSSSRAALIYQHASKDRDLEIAAALSKLDTGSRRPRLRLVVDPGTRCAPNAPLNLSQGGAERDDEGKSPDQLGGGERTKFKPEKVPVQAA